MSRAYPLLLSSIASEVWAIEQNYATHALAALEARIGNGGPWPTDERDARIAEGNLQFYRAAGLPIDVPSSDTGVARVGNAAVLQLVGLLMPRVSPLAATSGGGGTSLVSFAQNMTTAAHDPSVAAIVVLADSPGGTVVGTRDAYEAMREAAKLKEVTVIVSGTCASAAYWISSAATTLIMTPGSQVGSIGAVALHEDISNMAAKMGISTTTYASSRHKLDFSPHAPLSADAKANMKVMVDRAHQQFVGDVARGRGVTPAVVERDYGQGRMLDAQAAKGAGMVDTIEPLVKAVQRVMRLKPGTAPTPARLRANTPPPALRANADFRLRRHQQRIRTARLMEIAR